MLVCKYLYIKNFNKYNRYETTQPQAAVFLTNPHNPCLNLFKLMSVCFVLHLITNVPRYLIRS